MLNCQKMKKLFLLISGLIVICANAHALQITLQPGSEGIDTSFVNVGNYSYPDMEGLYVAYPEDNTYLYKTLMKFDLSSVTLTSVDSAILYLHTGHSVLDGEYKTVYLYRVIEDWQEATANWSNQPDITSEGVVTTYQPPSGITIEEWDITDMVNGWLSGAFPNYGFMITTDYYYYNEHGITSSDSPIVENRPKLVLTTYEASESVPEPVSVVLLIMGLVGINLNKKLRK